MAAVATHKLLGPYFTATIGPTIHSPPPIEAASRMAPGPIVRRTLASENGSGAGSSACVHGGRQP